MKYKTKIIVENFTDEKKANYYFPALKRYLLKNSVSAVSKFRDGFGIVLRIKRNFLLCEERAYNYVTSEGNYLLSEWVDRAWDFRGGFGIVRKRGKENVIRTNGTFLLENWVDEVIDFYDNDSVIIVVKHGKFNYVTSEGTYLLKDWVDSAWRFHEDFGVVKKGEKYNYITLKGEYLLRDWVDKITPIQREDNGEIEYFTYNKKRNVRIGLIEIDGLKYLVDSTGKIYEKEKEGYVVE